MGTPKKSRRHKLLLFALGALYVLGGVSVALIGHAYNDSPVPWIVGAPVIYLACRIGGGYPLGAVGIYSFAALVAGICLR